MAAEPTYPRFLPPLALLYGSGYSVPPLPLFYGRGLGRGCLPPCLQDALHHAFDVFPNHPSKPASLLPYNSPNHSTTPNPTCK
jgi:hypothetical protein